MAKKMSKKAWLAELNKRVDAGIKYLNKKYPGWETSIDLDRLDLRDRFSCVLGQMFQDYWDKVFSYESEKSETKNLSEDKAGEYGFALDEKENVDFGYDLLTKVWFMKITGLQCGFKKVEVS